MTRPTVLYASVLFVLYAAGNGAANPETREPDTGMRHVLPFYPKELDILIGHLQTKVRRRTTITPVSTVDSPEDADHIDSGQDKEDINEDTSNTSRQSQEDNDTPFINTPRQSQEVDKSDEDDKSDEHDKKFVKKIGLLKVQLFRLTTSLEACKEINAGNHNAGGHVISETDNGDAESPLGGRVDKLKSITRLREQIKAVGLELDICRFTFWSGGSRGELVK